VIRRGLLLLVGCLLLGCGSTPRPPPPLVTVEILSPYEFVLDGETVDKAVLKERLRQVADENRRPIVNNSRVYMHIIGVGPGTGGEVQALVSYCMSIGLDKIRLGN
jgi:hypothetical protein